MMNNQDLWFMSTSAANKIQLLVKGTSRENSRSSVFYISISLGEWTCLQKLSISEPISFAITKRDAYKHESFRLLWGVVFYRFWVNLGLPCQNLCWLLKCQAVLCVGYSAARYQPLKPTHKTAQVPKLQQGLILFGYGMAVKHQMSFDFIHLFDEEMQKSNFLGELRCTQVLSLLTLNFIFFQSSFQMKIHSSIDC